MDENYTNRLNWFRQSKEQIKGSKKTLIIGRAIAGSTFLKFRISEYL